MSDPHFGYRAKKRLTAKQAEAKRKELNRAIDARHREFGEFLKSELNEKPKQMELFEHEE